MTADTGIAPAVLQRYVEQILARWGTPPDIAGEVAAHLVGANLAGHDSHGVQRLPGYAAEARSGTLDPAARPEVLRERGATLLLDARRGFGHYSTRYAADRAAGAARLHGVGTAAVRHSGHIGRVGHYVERLAGQGLIGLVTVGMAGDGVGAMVLPGTTRRFLGANPWTIGIPAGDRPPLVVDVSSAMAAEGKVQVARAAGRSLPDGLIVDRDGRPSREPDDYFNGGGLLPLGGTAAGHKGYGLGLASALLGALAIIGDDAPTLAGAGTAPDADPRGRVAGVLLVVLDPAAFGAPDGYADLVAGTLAAVHRVPGDTVVPGEPEAATRARRADRVNLPAGTWAGLTALGDEYGLKAPCGSG